MEEKDSIEKPNNEETDELEEEKPRSKNSGKAIGIFIITVILIFGGILLFNYIKINNPTTIDDLHRLNLEGKETENNYIYNGFSIVKWDNLWFTQIQKQDIMYDISLRYGPRDVENVSIDINLGLIDPETFPEIYITIDPFTTDATYQALGVSELSLNLINGLGVMPRAACIAQDIKTI